jgi:hypothetical protein
LSWKRRREQSALENRKAVYKEDGRKRQDELVVDNSTHTRQQLKGKRLHGCTKIMLAAKVHRRQRLSRVDLWCERNM